MRPWPHVACVVILWLTKAAGASGGGPSHIHLFEPLRAGYGAANVAASALQACAVESVARAEPESTVVLWTNRGLLRRAATAPSALRLRNVERRGYNPAELGLSAALGGLQAIEAAALLRIVSVHGGVGLESDVVTLAAQRAGEWPVVCSESSLQATDALSVPPTEALLACVAQGHRLKLWEEVVANQFPDWNKISGSNDGGGAPLLSQIMKARCPLSWADLTDGRLSAAAAAPPELASGALWEVASSSSAQQASFAGVRIEDFEELPQRMHLCIFDTGQQSHRLNYDPVHLGAPLREHAVSECQTLLGKEKVPDNATALSESCVDDVMECNSFALLEVGEPLERGATQAVVFCTLTQKLFEFEWPSGDAHLLHELVDRFLLLPELEAFSGIWRNKLVSLLLALMPVEGQDDLKRALDNASILRPSLVEPGHFPRIVWLYWEARPDQGQSVSVGAAARTLTSHAPASDGWVIFALNSSTVGLFLSEEDLPASFSRLDFAARRSDVIRLALLHKYGGVWCDASILLNTSLDSIVLTHVHRGARFVAFVYKGFVETWMLASVRHGRVVSAWRAAFFRGLDDASSRAAQSGRSLDNELLDSTIARKTGRGTLPFSFNELVGVDLYAYMFVHLCLMHAQQNDATLLAGAEVALVRSEDGPFLLHSMGHNLTTHKLLEIEAALGHQVIATKLTSHLRFVVDMNWWQFKGDRTFAIMELVRRALASRPTPESGPHVLSAQPTLLPAPESADASACSRVTLELLRPGDLEPVVRYKGSLQVRMRFTAPDPQNWWVCVSLLNFHHAETNASCIRAADAAAFSLAPVPLGRFLLRMWAQLDSGAPCESAQATVLRQLWGSAVVPPSDELHLQRIGFRCGAGAVPGLRGGCASPQPQCALAFPERGAAGRRGVAGAQDVREGGGLAVIVLVNRGGRSLAEATESWHAGGLLARAQRRVMFLQEWKHAAASELETEELEEQRQRETGRPRSRVRHVDAADSRVSLLPAAYDFEVIGARDQRGIGPALAALVSEVLDAEHVIFLEEDWALAESVDAAVVADILEQARSALREGVADIVKLRHRIFPGRPFVSADTWQGREREILRLETPINSNHSVLDTLHWLHDPSVYFAVNSEAQSSPVWRCGKDAQLFCAFSTHQRWTNNPFVIEPRFFTENIRAAALTYVHLEEISSSPHLWDNPCLVIAQGQGLFTHRDWEKPLELQSPCEDQFGAAARARVDAVHRAIAKEASHQGQQTLQIA